MARLPQPGSDQGQWGTILNDFLSQSLGSDGSLIDGSIVETKLSTAVQSKLNAVGSGGVVSVNGQTGVVTLTKSDVTLGNIDNTSDVNKPVSTAQQTALNLKANLASPTFTGTVTVPTPTNPTDATTKTYVDAAAAAGTPDATTLVKGKIQLAGDLAGTAALPTVPGLASKEPTITATTSADYYRGDKTFQPLNKTAVGLGNVDNTSDAAKNTAVATLTNKTLTSPTIAKIGNLTANGMVTTTNSDGTLVTSTFPLDSTKFLDGFGNFTTPQDTSKLAIANNLSDLASASTARTNLGLGNVNNTSDANKPISTATQTALNLKADATTVGVKTLLIDTAGDLPAGTPAGVIVVVKS